MIYHKKSTSKEHSLFNKNDKYVDVSFEIVNSPFVSDNNALANRNKVHNIRPIYISENMPLPAHLIHALNAKS